MGNLLRRHSLILTSLALIIFSCQLMSMSINDPSFARLGARLLLGTVSPFERIFHEFQDSTRYAWTHYLWLLDVESERNELLSRIKSLEAYNSRLIEYKSENLRLRGLLQFSEDTGLYGVAAQLIGRDPSNWVKTITINRGISDGIEVGYPVVDGNAVVGQIIAVTEHSAKVLLVADSRSAIDVIVQSSRASGIVEGSLDQTLRLRYVLKEYEVKPGDRIIASGLDEVFPKGTLIGVVTEVDPHSSGLFDNIQVQPSVDLNRLENVLVLRPLLPNESATDLSDAINLEQKEISVEPDSSNSN